LTACYVCDCFADDDNIEINFTTKKKKKQMPPRRSTKVIKGVQYAKVKKPKQDKKVAQFVGWSLKGTKKIPNGYQVEDLQYFYTEFANIEKER